MYILNEKPELLHKYMKPVHTWKFFQDPWRASFAQQMTQQGWNLKTYNALPVVIVLRISLPK